MYVTDWLAKRAQLSPQRVALLEPEKKNTLSYGEWNSQVQQLARFFQQTFACQQGEIVAILALNSIDYLDTWFACGRLGAILQNLNWRLSREELLQLLQETPPKALVYDPEFLETVTYLQKKLPQIERWIALGETARDGDLLFGDRQHCSTEPLAPVPLSPNDPWMICYTGGTTGLPKGAILSHGNVTANAINTITSWGLDRDDRAILNAPLFHVGGLNVFTSPLVYIGGSSIVCRGFDVEQVFDLLGEEAVTLFFGVPTMFVLMQEHPRWAQADFSRLKFVISGGAPCPLPVFEKFWDKGVPFKTGYGLTEAGPNTFWLPEEDVQRKPGSVGFPLMHVDIRISDDAGNPLPPGEVGELLIRGPHVFQGYWNKAEATAEALRDGWLHTGDLARLDEEGYAFVVGRLKEMIISGGENIYPAEVESVLHAHHSVAEAALIGVPDPTWGEVGLALLRAESEDSTPSPDELRQHCQQHLARYKIPKRFVFVQELPKTGAGKIDKKTLAQQYRFAE